jgi:glycosyltransferase involved in cell wall biosynthesis
MPPKLSILLPTFNCADTVGSTLETVRWADEILVVDSFSTDATLEVCRDYGARIVQHEYVNSARQKNWAVTHCRHEWVLQIDSDETLEPGLPEEIESALAGAPDGVQAYRLPRKNHILGRWAKWGGLYPDFQTRLFQRDVGQWVEREVHAHIAVSGEVRTLRGHLLHHGMAHISRQLRNLDRYTRYEADEAHKSSRRFRWPQLFLRPGLIFLHRFVWLQGFRDGWRGFLAAAYTATYDFWAHAKLWELETLNLERSPK